ncbi:zinc-dependent alcohol dehydrogenase [Flaviflexus massiliensis]|uniref:zinc-dependent alcohol dehydrogenase n=1 Tax=Flaviflexus massiliensis TaxID=1522309 RepID=UPI0006D5B15D|nr:alcohol dehydrogenase catalytic domain-containing protein [Flaviflexus massiliensis]
MRAIKFDTNREATVVEIERPEPRPGQVVVRVTSTGVCGSDLSALSGHHLFRKPPLISGHEAGGIIDAVGEGVDGFDIGDRVVIDPQKPCGECDFCERGLYHLCPQKVMLGVAEWDGSFADFVEVPAYTLIPAPDGVADEHLALAEPIAVAAHAVRQLAEKSYQTALVLGGGTIGSLITRVLSDNGVVVTVSEPREFLHPKLKDLGASTVAVPGEIEPESKFDVVFIVASIAQLVQTALDHLKPGGSIVQVAVFNEEVPIHIGKLQVAEQSFHGTAMYQKEDFARALELLAKYADLPDLLISKITSLEEGAPLITGMAKKGPGEILKLILVP